MTKDHLLKYLRDPNYLNQISYQELKTLVAEYPSSLSLRYLLALKSKQENNEDYQRQLAFLSTYSIDRSQLFEVFNKRELQEMLPEGVVLEEDYLELRELSELERELGTIATVGASAIAIDDAIGIVNTGPKKAMVNSPDQFGVPANEDFYTLDFSEELQVDNQAKNTENTQEQIKGNLAEIESLFKDIDQPPADSAKEKVIDTPETDLEIHETLKGGEFPEIPLEVLDTEVEVYENGQPVPPNGVATNSIEPIVEEEGLQVNPVPKTSFTTWFRKNKTATYFDGFDLIGYNSKGLIEELIETKQYPSGKENAETTINMGADIASETLAQLLVEQEHYGKAIIMYEQLKLIYPEKSSFFAGEIQRLEEMINNS